MRREYETITQKERYVGEFRYKPVKCKKEYRVIVLKKIVNVTKGQQLLFEDCRYMFYITNIYDKSAKNLLHFIHGRCDHENKIKQLSNGIHALKMPAAEFKANWAYMVICSLAWNLKSWMGLLIPDCVQENKIINCEFKSFQNKLINIPCQILNTGRKIIYRFLNYNSIIKNLLSVFQAVKRLRFSST
ncbi:MAG: transposase [Spirochaetota bacterium]|nr:transposase [Spirochaetota bacterium]